MLWQSINRPGPKRKTGGEQKEKRVRKNGSEKGRRDRERHHLARISRLFKAPKEHWSKKEVLSLGEIFFLIDEPDQPLTNLFQSFCSYCTLMPSPTISLRSAPLHWGYEYAVDQMDLYLYYFNAGLPSNSTWFSF